jgi:site-specific DNA-methyltransferase (adenine-specific)
VIHHGDCLNVMATFDAESIDAIVTDPPYGLGFMGKAWDRAHQHEPWAREALRVAKPGAYLLAFGGTRTVHRMACAIEDAGWIIRDLLVWGYASGFPKGRANLKPAWEPIVMARKPGPLRMLAIDECRIALVDGDAKRGGFGNGGIGFGGDSGAGAEWVDRAEGRWPANVILTDPIFDGGWDGVVGGGAAGGWYAEDTTRAGRATGTGFQNGDGSERIGYGDSGTYSRFFAIPVTIGACRYCGVRIADGSSTASPTPATPSGTAPAPASSPPSSSLSDLAPSAAAPSAAPGGSSALPSAALWDAEDGGSRSDSPDTNGTETRSSNESGPTTPPTPRNRPPGTSPRSASPSAPASPADQSATSSATTTTTPDRWTCASCADVAMRSSTDEPGFAEQPDSPRFLIIPKAARSDREPVLGGAGGRVVPVWGGDEDDLTPGKKSTVARRNVHPTVKPVDLMRHLVRLVTPPGGTVLDPFLGSGTTGLAAEMEGFAWIGIEKEAEYVAIAEARLNGTQKGLAL